MSAPFQPQTAREALLEIGRITAASQNPQVAVTEIATVAAAGLQRTEPINFELSDQLADRLAEAHGLLARLKERMAGMEVDAGELLGQIEEALALPPDLEAMVERRIGAR